MFQFCTILWYTLKICDEVHTTHPQNHIFGVKKKYI
jgi:hypothetical protein